MSVNCPNCSAQVLDGSADCPQCGLHLDKWRATSAPAAAPAAAAPQRSTLPPRPQEQSSPVVLWGGLVAAALAYWFFFRTVPEAPAPTAAPMVSAATLSEAQASIPNPWKFEGSVIDAHTLKPIGGATLVFPRPAGDGSPFQVLTDADGKFNIQLPALEQGGYRPHIAHPHYQPHHVRGPLADMSPELRGRLRCPKAAEDGPLQGALGQTTPVEFGLCRNPR